MKKSEKMIGRGEGALGQDEPEILDSKSNAWKLEPYRLEGGRKVKRSTGVKARRRVAPLSAEGRRRQLASRP